MIKVGVIGAAGRMGREVCKAVCAAQDMTLACAIDVVNVGHNLASIVQGVQEDLEISDHLAQSIDTSKPDAIVDFTNPNAAASNAIQALEHGAAAIIGTSGLSNRDLQSIEEAAEHAGKPALYVPNFAIGAVLMMKFAQQAAKYLPEVEIIELHHDKKADAPSGTAMRTAELIADARSREPNPDKTELVKTEGARGALYKQTRIHSIRLPGLLAHQMVVFGAPGEVLTISHDSMDRSSFMPGVLLAIRNIHKYKGLIVGLENIME